MTIECSRCRGNHMRSECPSDCHARGLANQAKLDTIEACAKIAKDHTPAKHEGTLAAHVTGHTIEKAILALALPRQNIQPPEK